MRIGFDARYVSHGLTGGVRTYVYHLARALPRSAPDHEFVYYVDQKAPFELHNLPSNVAVRTLPWNGPLSSVLNDFRLARWMERDALDVAHCPGNYGPRTSVPLVVTLHDTINVFPLSQHLRGFGRSPRQVAMMLYLGRMTRAGLRRASWVIAVSNHARRDIAARTGYPLSRLTTVYEAASQVFRPIEDSAELERIRVRLSLGTRFVLADGIKNPAVAIEAFRGLPGAVRAGVQLVFFSREATPRPAVQEALDDPRVRFVPRPSDDDLVAMMNLASVFVLPSWYEGFGLPLGEAMQCGTPVIGSSRGSIPEVIGDAGLVFDVEEPRQLAHALGMVLEDESLRTYLSQQALRRASQFSWERAARETLDVYEQVVRTAPHAMKAGHRAAHGQVENSIRG
jgi:glycosyltransferase involved in cell wall biosynthesis